MPFKSIPTDHLDKEIQKRWEDWEKYRKHPELRPKPEPWMEDFVKETYRVWGILDKAVKDLWKLEK